MCVCIYIYIYIYIYRLYIYIYRLSQRLSSDEAICNAGVGKGWEDPLEEGAATDSSILSWRIPWTEEPDKLQSRVTKSQTQLK